MVIDDTPYRRHMWRWLMMDQYSNHSLSFDAVDDYVEDHVSMNQMSYTDAWLA